MSRIKVEMTLLTDRDTQGVLDWLERSKPDDVTILRALAEVTE